jgi:cysteine-rich repeat protein
MVQINKREKKAVSIMVGYVLLITIAIAMGIIAYNWMKTYLPTTTIECPEGVSIFIKEADFEASTSTLTITLKNNGRFNVLGYYIYAKNSSEQPLAAIDLSKYLTSGGIKAGNYISFAAGSENSFTSNQEAIHVFNILPEIGSLYSISIIPARIEEQKNKQRFVSCSNAKTEQIVGEPAVPCVAETCLDFGYTECNPPGWDRSDGCGGMLDCGTCPAGKGCDENGICQDIPPQCGDFVINSADEECDNGLEENGGTNGVECAPPYGGSCTYCTALCKNSELAGGFCGNSIVEAPEICDGNSQSCTINSYSGTQACNADCLGWNACTTTEYCGDGSIDGSEYCDDGNTAGNDGCSATCTIEEFWACNGEPSLCSINVISCQTYCVSLKLGYSGTLSGCTSSSGVCASNGGDYQSGGNQWCTGGPQADSCCCKPAV